MKKNYYYVVVVLLTIMSWATPAYSQSPYSISPDWYFGRGGRLTFTNGNFPISGAPTVGSIGTTTAAGAEASTSICHPTGAVAVYTNTMHAFNGNPANVDYNNNIRNFSAFGDQTCAGSATGGGVSFPDPQNANSYYVILCNDRTGGDCGLKGINRYRFTGTGTGVVYAAGPTQIADNTYSEALTATTDGDGGYWVIAHAAASTANTFTVWHFTSTGITGPTNYTVGAALNDSPGDQAFLRVSPCQDKIAFLAGRANQLTISNFNRATGVVGGEIKRVSGTGAGVGLEFSPDGSRVYYSGLGSQVNWVAVSSGASGTVTGANSWTMQMGPDGNIYTSGMGGGSSTIGRITGANSAPTHTAISLTGGATILNGMINEAWLSPKTPVIPAPTISGCNATITFDFDTYFGTNVDVLAADVTWDFGDGTGTHTFAIKNPTYTFPASATAPKSYTVTVSFTDNYCGHTWTATRSVSINCPLPIELISFNGYAGDLGAVLKWQTATEKNNEYFDLQRSLDGIHFESVAHIKGAGNSSKLLYYTYNDPSVTAGKVYYRLDQYDFDGTKSSSKVVVVQFGRSLSAPFTLAPNPFSSSFVINKLYDEAATIFVYDILGRLLEQKYSIPEEKTLVLGEELSNGSYIVKYVSQSSTYTLHIEKK